MEVGNGLGFDMSLVVYRTLLGCSKVAVGGSVWGRRDDAVAREGGN